MGRWWLIPARSFASHRRRGRNQKPLRQPFDVHLHRRKTTAGPRVARRRDNSNRAVKNLDGNHQRKVYILLHLSARKVTQICVPFRQADCSKSARWDTDARRNRVHPVGSPSLAGRAGWLPARDHSAWPGCAVAVWDWIPRKQARRWKLKVARRRARRGASRLEATRAPPRRARRRRRSSCSTRPARRSARRRALATRQPRRRARRGPRHGCQGTGWRPGKPRVSRKGAGSSRAPRAHRTTRTRDHAVTAHESQNAVPNLACQSDERRPQRPDTVE